MAGKPQQLDALGAAAARWFEELDDRGVFITDDRLIVRRWNHWLAAQTGRRAEDIVGRPLLELFPELVSRGLDASYRDALAGEVRMLSQRLHKYLLPITRNFHGAGMTEMAQSARIEPIADGGPDHRDDYADRGRHRARDCRARTAQPDRGVRAGTANGRGSVATQG